MSTLSRVLKVTRSLGSRRSLHASSCRAEITKFQMPAMSPTMTEGGIASWKKKEGESFTAGDVLLEIETDKATIDVEAQDDGILGKVIKADGSKNVPVGAVIALLAQEGDDISNLEIPAEEASAPTPPPPSVPKAERKEEEPKPAPPSPPQPSQSGAKTQIDHSKPVFPSVLRLLEENHVADVSSIKGTGIRGMLTKGDVLAYLGKASGPTGTWKDTTPTPSVYKQQAVPANAKLGAPPPKAPLDATAIRKTIVAALLADSIKSRTPAPSPVLPSVDFIIDEYLPRRPTATATPVAPASTKASLPSPKTDELDGLH
ncbi:hypothetical protein M422DRAFT_30559 [Sphaerobolus stellatus SS14]|uniref:Unplaced genomic scaffold SPHSTscaffold_44, whole genome shotgun sequence n=1 Tax=Sphaerobolus stellatus (strain SS14) TaxID=990650 RepID=A0A0C9VYC0_SPHS4|nr:hypothetical protein M422DRAFT_30559 [Sphaerobolus stellatus SS14]